MSQSRYRDSTLVVDSGTRWISPETPFVDTDPRYDDVYHVIQQHDRLDLLAHRYLGEATLWWVIAEYNDIFWIFDLEVGATLRIPSFEHLQLDLLR